MRKILSVPLICTCLVLLLATSSNFVAAADLVYDDFNDGALGTNVMGGAGAMSPDVNMDGVGDYDPTLVFSTDSYEGGRALSITYSFPSGQWCGYWSQAMNRDVSGYSEIRLWVKGTTGNEQFKLELKSGATEVSIYYVTNLGTSWNEKVIPLSSFTGTGWAGYTTANLSRLQEVNIIFDRAPFSSTVYLDYIRFTGGTSALQNPTASFTYSPASPRAGDSITFNASGSSDEDGTIVSYSWNFGDGTTGSGVTTSHTYQTSGNYNVTLTVTDNDGLTDTYSAILAVLGQTSGDNQPGGGQPGTDNQPGGGTGIIISTNELIIGIVILVVIVIIVAFLISRRKTSGGPSGW